VPCRSSLRAASACSSSPAQLTSIDCGTLCAAICHALPAPRLAPISPLLVPVYPRVHSAVFSAHTGCADAHRCIWELHMLFASAGGTSAKVDVVSIGDTDPRALNGSLGKFELRRAHCFDPNEVGGVRSGCLLGLIALVLVATGTEAAGGHGGSAGGGAGVRANDPRAGCRPRQDGAALWACGRACASRAALQPQWGGGACLPWFERRASNLICCAGGHGLRKKRDSEGDGESRSGGHRGAWRSRAASVGRGVCEWWSS